MSKTYIPRTLSDTGLPPVFDLNDIIYMKFIKDGKAVRVARMNPSEGVARVLSPTENPNEFYAEAFCSVDQKSAKIKIERHGLSDEIWLGLLDNVPVPKLLSSYEHQMLGYYPSGSYLYENGNRSFHIIEMEEKDCAK